VAQIVILTLPMPLQLSTFTRYALIALLAACSAPNAEPTTRLADRRQNELAAAPRELHGCMPRWTSLEEGLAYRTVGCSNDKPSLIEVRFNPREWRFNAAVERNSGAERIALKEGASFAINANFFDTGRNPIGLVLRDGKIVQPVHSVSWQSLFWTGRDGAGHISSPAEWSAVRRANPLMAVQTGPRIVTHGKRGRLHASGRARRSGVCLFSEGNISFFVSGEAPYTVAEISQLAVKPEADGGLGCRDAMLFDGGPSAQLYVRTAATVLNVPGDRVPAFVTARPNR
jgi:hypothetical protein